MAPKRTAPSRRDFVGSIAKLAGMSGMTMLFPPSVQRALAVPPRRRTGTIQDVEHIIILTQENRSFDHYFGTLSGVRGFADPFPIPVPDRGGRRGKTVWHQPNSTLFPSPPIISAFHLNTAQNFEHMRVEGTPHSWSDAQLAWNHGRLDAWTNAKHNHSLGYFAKEDIPYQWALANAFTICDAYHCSAQTGTNPNRLFIWTGTNDPNARGNGPAFYNDYDWFDQDPGHNGGYAWTTYAERLEQAGVSWQIYQDMADNFTDNPLAGFKTFRDAWFQKPGYSQSLRDRGVSTRDLDALADDARNGRLPQVAWVIATAEGSEHPGPSSPAQGAAYIERVIEALTANPEVWAKTVLFINFDENDGFFDHVPPPAPPSRLAWNEDPSTRQLAGASTVDTSGEYHENLPSYHDNDSERRLLNRPYGLGPRVPMYVISPWSKGGWVNSQVFDHTSVIRFLEERFGVHEPNISKWRRAVCGDLTSAFDFSGQDYNFGPMPTTAERAEHARSLGGRATPPTPNRLSLPSQEAGVRRSRALPYELHVTSLVQTNLQVELTFANTGSAGAVFHVYNRLDLEQIPRRYTVESGKALRDVWETSSGAYDLWVIAPNGFHRHFMGDSSNVVPPSKPNPEIRVTYEATRNQIFVTLGNTGGSAAEVSIAANRYRSDAPTTHSIPAHGLVIVPIPMDAGPWYDFSVTSTDQPDFLRRFAGRLETGADSFSDPAMGGQAINDQFKYRYL